MLSHDLVCGMWYGKIDTGFNKGCFSYPNVVNWNQEPGMFGVKVKIGSRFEVGFKHF